MPRRCLALAALLALCIPSLGRAPAPFPRREARPAFPVGTWRIAFTNGVVQWCEVRKDGTASVSEPNRSSPGKVTRKGTSFFVVCDDDRTERWTPDGRRMAVEHWCPGAPFPGAAAARGVAERVR